MNHRFSSQWRLPSQIQGISSKVSGVAAARGIGWEGRAYNMKTGGEKKED
jgi:hypothetical protein